ncbi:MAG TPA: ParB N-terminal domain-containing protein [Syntrophomonas sp.]|nr:ParB N-terminal domain-containing protein [Syntrophomonas sp.]
MGKKQINYDTPSFTSRIKDWPIKMVRVTDIIENPDNVRVYFDKSETLRLAKSIEENGLVYELILQPDKIGKYELIDGHRRIRAIRTLGWDMVQAKIAPYQLDSEQIQALMLLTDTQHKAWNKYDVAKRCASAWQKFSPASLAAEQMGMTLKQFQYFLPVGLLDSATIKKAIENKIPFEFTAQSAEKFATNAFSKKTGMTKSAICSLLMDKYIQGKMQPISQYNACLSQLPHTSPSDIKFWLENSNDLNVLTALTEASANTQKITGNLIKSLGHIEAKIRTNKDKFDPEELQRIQSSMQNISRALKSARYYTGRK